MQVPLCRHIKANGIQCHAVALADSVFCYYHRRLNEGHRIYRSTMIGKRGLLDRGHIIALPALEDRVSVQLALSEVINALACNFIDPQRANALLFGLKLAAANAKGLEAIPQPQEVVRHFSPSPDILDSVAVDIAPPGRTCDLADLATPAQLPAAAELPAPSATPSPTPQLAPEMRVPYLPAPAQTAIILSDLRKEAVILSEEQRDQSKDPDPDDIAATARTLPPPVLTPTLALCASAASLCNRQPATGNGCPSCPHTPATLQSTEPLPQLTTSFHQPATQYEGP